MSRSPIGWSRVPTSHGSSWRYICASSDVSFHSSPCRTCQHAAAFQHYNQSMLFGRYLQRSICLPSKCNFSDLFSVVVFNVNRSMQTRWFVGGRSGCPFGLWVGVVDVSLVCGWAWSMSLWFIGGRSRCPFDLWVGVVGLWVGVVDLWVGVVDLLVGVVNVPFDP